MFFKKVRSYEEYLITTRLWILKETKTNKNYRSYRSMFKIHSENRNRKSEPCNTSKLSLCCKQVIETSTFQSKCIICLVECALCKAQSIKKAHRSKQPQERCKQSKIYPCWFAFKKTWVHIQSTCKIYINQTTKSYSYNI